MRPVMRSTPAWEMAYRDIQLLAECLSSYKNYMDEQKNKVENNRQLEHPVRQISENTSVWSVHKNASGTSPKYKLLDKALVLADYFEPVVFDEQLHLEKNFDTPLQRLRYFENLQLSVPVDVIKYYHGGGVVTIYCIVKVKEDRSEGQKMSEVLSIMSKIKPVLPEYHTRSMKKQFKDKVKNIASIQPSLVDFLYKLTSDASVAATPEMQQRLRMIFMAEIGLLPDVRKLNKGRPNQIDEFFAKMEEVVEQFTAADERRHNVARMSEILSLKDLINQTKEKCAEGTDIPSAAFVRLQFTPRNPYTHTALNFTSRLQVQYKIQRRQLRISHPDDYFCGAQFKYLKSLAIRLGDDCSLFFCDDKAKVAVGQSNIAVSTGIRGKKTLAPVSTTLVAADHDLQHSGSLTPSVYMRCELPTEIDKVFFIEIMLQQPSMIPFSSPLIQ